MGPGDEWEGKVKMSFLTVSRLSPLGKGLISGGKGRGSGLLGVGCSSASLALACTGSIVGGGGLRSLRALVKEPLTVALMAAWMRLGWDLRDGEGVEELVIRSQVACQLLELNFEIASWMNRLLLVRR